MPRPPHGARAMTNDERQALRRLRYRTMREELERLRAEVGQLRGLICWTLDALAGGSPRSEIEKVLRGENRC